MAAGRAPRPELTEADAWKAKALRLERRLTELRRVRARVAGIAHALNAAMAARDDARERVRGQELAKAREEAAAAKDERVDLRLAHWKASNAASTERLTLETAQAESVNQRAEQDRVYRQALDDAGQELARARDAASRAQAEIERGFEDLRTLEPGRVLLASGPRPPPWPWDRAAGRAVLGQADRLRDAGRYAEAAGKYAAACAALPRRWDLCVRTADMLRQAGSLVAAEHYCRQALLLAPRQPDIFTELGEIYTACGRESAARMAYEHARTLKAQADGGSEAPV